MLDRPFGDPARRQARQSQGGDDVHEQPQPKREVRAERHHQNETGEHCPDDAPRGVDAVRAAHLAAARRVAGRYEIGEQREGHSHPDRRYQHDGADGEAHGEEALGGAERLHLEHGDDVARQQAENEEQQAGARGGQGLSPGGGGRGFGGDGAATGHKAATDPDAEQKHQQHERKSVRGPADDHHQHARPGNFVEQGGEGGEAEQHQGHAAQEGGRGVHGISRDPGLAPGVSQSTSPRSGQPQRGYTYGQVHGGRTPKACPDAHVLD